MTSIALNHVNHSLTSGAEGSIDSTVSFDGPLSDFLVDDGQRLSDSFGGSLRVLSDTFVSEFFDDEVAGMIDQDLLNHDLHPRASEENFAAHVQEQERQMYHQQHQQLHQLEHQLHQQQQQLHLLEQRQREQEQAHQQQQEQEQQEQQQQQQQQQHTRHQNKYHRIQPLDNNATMSLDKLSAQVDSNDSNEDALYPPWEKFKVLKNVRKCWESDRIANPVPMKKIKLDGSKNISRGIVSPNTTNFTTVNDDHNTSTTRKLEFNPPSSSSSSASVGSGSESNTDSSKSNNSAKLEVKSFWVSCCGYWGGRKSGHETGKDTFLTPSASACQLSDMTAGLKQEYNNTR